VHTHLPRKVGADVQLKIRVSTLVFFLRIAGNITPSPSCNQWCVLEELASSSSRLKDKER